MLGTRHVAIPCLDAVRRGTRVVPVAGHEDLQWCGGGVRGRGGGLFAGSVDGVCGTRGIPVDGHEDLQ